MKEKIFPMDMLPFHPYDKTDEVDQYYAGVATQIYQILKASDISVVLADEEKIRHTAMALTGYFEDIISETGIWQTFSMTCKRRYGTYVPFYETDEDYYADEINPQDVCFLLWRLVQNFYRKEAKVVNPLNEALHYIASAIYATFDSLYEDAPVNQRMKDFLAERIDPNDPLSIEKRIIWFYNNYLQTDNLFDIPRLVERVSHEGALRESDKEMVIKDSLYNLYYNGRNNLLCLPNHEWLALLMQNHPDHALFENLKALENSFYEVTEDESGCFYLKDLHKEPGERTGLKLASKNIAGEALPLRSQLTPGKSIVSCRLTFVGGCYYINGDYVALPLNDDFLKSAAEYREEQKNAEENRLAAFHDFMYATGNKFFIFLKDAHELADFFEKRLNYAPGDKMNFGKDLKGGIMLAATPQGGLTFHSGSTEGVKSEDNPFYNPAEAGEKAFVLVVSPDNIGYQLSCILQDKGALADARMNSDNPEDGHKLVQKYMDCWRDLFFHKCREKDFDNDAELQKYL